MFTFPHRLKIKHKCHVTDTNQIGHDM